MYYLAMLAAPIRVFLGSRFPSFCPTSVFGGPLNADTIDAYLCGPLLVFGGIVAYSNKHLTPGWLSETEHGPGHFFHKVMGKLDAGKRRRNLVND